MTARVGLERRIADAMVVLLVGATLCLNVGAQSMQSGGKPQITNAKVEEREVRVGLAQELDAWARRRRRRSGLATPCRRWTAITECAAAIPAAIGMAEEGAVHVNWRDRAAEISTTCRAAT